jgi:amino acid transporter
MTPRRLPGPAGPDDPRLGRLLRWYPRAWRDRYGEEFLALVEDSLDGGRPGWRLRLGVARAGLRERGHRARLAGRRPLPRLARGLAGEPGFVTIAAGYLVAILAYVLGISHERQTGAILDMLTALTGLAGLALMVGLLATLPALILLLRAGRRPKVRRGLVWAAGATVATGAGLAWLTFWSGSSSLTPLSPSPTCLCGLMGTVLALMVALREWTAVARRLDLTLRVRVAERLLGTVAVPAVVVMLGVAVIWYSVINSPAFWPVWGIVWFATRGTRTGGGLRRGWPG